MTQPAVLLPVPRLLSALAQAAFLAALPDGGQGRARRNAWASRSGDAVRARGRREAETAVHAALLRTEASAGARGRAGTGR